MSENRPDDNIVSTPNEESEMTPWQIRNTELSIERAHVLCTELIKTVDDHDAGINTTLNAIVVALVATVRKYYNSVTFRGKDPLEKAVLGFLKDTEEVSKLHFSDYIDQSI